MIKSALDLKRYIEVCAAECSASISGDATTVCSSFATDGGIMHMELTKYGDNKYFGLAKYKGLVGRVKVDKGKASTLSLELSTKD